VLYAALPKGARAQLPDPAAVLEPLLASLRFRPYPDVRPALAGYRLRGLRLVLVSNWDVSLHEVLAKLGLADLLDGVLTSAEVGMRKPAPEIFQRALALARVPAHEALHVGDSLQEDIAGARGAGIEAVLIRRDGRLEPGVRTIRSLAELLC
jgi:putative hydrolase of the HAD superfamily